MSRNTTLCYIENDGRYLMLLRNKKKQDENANKWIGVGGKFLEGESPEECLLRETYEETGLHLTEYRYRGMITFVSDEWGTEYMHLFTATAYEGQLSECTEGELHWVAKADVMNLNLWEGDRAFLKLLMEDASFFTMKLRYQGELLVEVQTKKY